jgi:hypothetical protein
MQFYPKLAGLNEKRKQSVYCPFMKTNRNVHCSVSRGQLQNFLLAFLYFCTLHLHAPPGMNIYINKIQFNETDAKTVK